MSTLPIPNDPVRGRLTRTWLPAGIAVTLAAAAASALVTSAPAGAATATATVNFGTVTGHTTPYSLGVDSSTYGATPLSNSTESTNEQRLDARFVRIPVGYRNGKVTSSAGGAGYVDVPSLVAKYRAWGFHVVAVVGGRTNDFDVQPGDATAIMKALGFTGVDYSAPNEPNNMGKSLQDEASVAHMIVAEGRALNPSFQLWGPVWSYYNRSDLSSYAQLMGTQGLGIDYHHYGMGSTWLSTSQLMASTPTWGTEVSNERSDLTSLGLAPNVNVDEVNMSWQYNDGTPASQGGDGSGGNLRFFTAVNTVFIASACGHILAAGGTCMPYATQNGPLGMLVEGGNTNPDNRPASTPMPAYWGIGAWTGASLWSHMKDTFYATTSSDPNTEVYAVNNEAGGYNLVLINKSQTTTNALTLGVNGVAAGTYNTFQTNPGAPYDAPKNVASGSYTNSVGVTLAPMSVTTLVLAPGTTTTGSTPPPATPLYRIAAGGNSVSGYQSPGTMVAGGTAASNPGTTTPPSGVPAAVFAGERWGVQTYTLPVSGSAKVKIRLLFSERYAGAQKVGARQFTIAVNGKTVATNFDIWVHQGQVVGASTELDAVVAPVNGAVKVSLTTGAAGSPTINGILIDTAS